MRAAPPGAPQLETSFAQPGRPLGEPQLAHLRRLGIDLDSPPPSSPDEDWHPHFRS
jgi:hypothetical protein